MIAFIDDREVVQKILAHLNLPTRPLPLLPARRPVEPELPFGPSTVELPAAFDEWLDEPPDASRLPAWMKATHEMPAQGRARGSADFDHIDEPVDVSRLPAWMRAAAPRRRARPPRWSSRMARRSAVEHGFWPDEPVDLGRLPNWMRTGNFWGPAPPDWDGVDAPSPGAEAFVDPIYDEPA